MAQHRALSCREDRGHPTPSSTDPPRTNDIDPTQILMQPPALKATVNRLRSHPPIEQLPPTNHPMLHPRQPRDH